MIGSLSNFGEALVLDSVFGRRISYNWPGTLHIALFTIMPDDSGANGSEVVASGTGYSRLPISNNSTNFPQPTEEAPETGIRMNGTPWIFPTSLSTWGEVRGAGIYDASTGGNLLWLWEWNQPRIVSANDTMRVDAEELQFTFNAIDPGNDCVLSFAYQCRFLSAFFGAPSAPSIPTELYAALMTTVPTPDDSGGAELGSGAGNYSRVLVPNDVIRWPDYVNGGKTNGQQIVWPQASGSSWTGVTGVAFYGSPTGLDLVAKCKHNASGALSWVAGDQPRIAAGALPLHAD